MKSKVFATALLVALVGSLLAAVPTQAAKKSKPLQVAKDEAGDWGCNQDCSLNPLGDGLGQDLVGAAIEMADKKTVNFILQLNSLPGSGGVPEISRYTWELNVNGQQYQMSGAFTEYIRGTCNPTTTNTCPEGEPRDPGSAPFFLRQGPCTVGVEMDCTEVALLHAEFNPEDATITIPVALSDLKAKPGSKIAPGAGASFPGTIYAAPGAFVTQANLPHDSMMVEKTFVVPKAKKKKKK